eukprot:428903_1
MPLLLVILVLHMLNVHCKALSKPYNVLFIVSDDLRADIGGYYGQNDVIYTPNIDAFQNRAFTFTHAYTQQAVCGPTRASFLTGTRPDTTRVWNIGPYFRDRMINNTGQYVITLPQYFKDYGEYYTIGSGKVFHPGTSSGGSQPDSCNMGNDMPYSWSQKYWDCDGTWTAEVQSPAQNGCPNSIGCTQSQTCLDCFTQWGCYGPNATKQLLVCPANCADDCFPDADVATQTLKYFAQITANGTKQPDKPFFIGAGLKRPHMGFYAPIRYYEQYGYNTNYSNIAIAKHTTIPQNAPIKATNNASAVSGWGDVKPYLYDVNYKDPQNGKMYRIRYVNTSYHNHLRAAYYASVAFMDAQFGRIIQGLYEYDLWDTTVIAFTGDHGWHLGEQGCWAKFTNFEVSVRVPLIIRVPGMNEGQASDVLVEQLDIFPTLIEASGLGFKNKSNITKQLEGKSLFKIIKDPSYYENYYAYSQYPRGGTAPDFSVMGISMRTSQWRYTEWIGWNAGTNNSKPFPIWDTIYGIELYNHSNN